MVVEDMAEVKVIGQMDNTIDHTFESANRVYDKDGLCPTIPTCAGGGIQPKIIEDFYSSRKPRAYDDVAPTIRAEREGPKVVEEKPASESVEDAKTTRGSDVVSTIRASYFKNGERNIAENIKSGKGYEDVVEKTSRYRIRKLTPRECWRLMAFSDEDFDKAASVVSNTQLYKTAGNSIVVTVLEAIFSQMNIKGVKPWNEVNK